MKVLIRKDIRSYLTMKDKKSRYKFIHELVITTFKGLRPTGLQIDHKDRNSLNNNLNNLIFINIFSILINAF